MAKFKKTLAAFAMPVVALIAAAVTCFFVPFDKQYLDYFDFRTLACLFCTLAVVCAFKNIRFFRWLADVIVRRFKTVRRAVIALVFVTYFGSMIMANDMALITFLPLGFLVLESCAQRKYLAFVFVMQNVAANLGGMLTPFGNPQNLYLYSFYSYSAGEFFRVMAVPFAVAFILIGVLSVCQAVENRGCFDAGAASAVVQDCCVFRTVCSVGAHSFSCFSLLVGAGSRRCGVVAP